MLRPCRSVLLVGTLVVSACAEADGDSSGEIVGNTPNVAVPDTLEADCGFPWAAESAEFEQQVFELVNEVRSTGTTCGGESAPAVPALALNQVLICTARAHSKDMGDNDYFEHESLDGRSPFERMTDAGYEFGGAAENIAMGQQTPASVMETWLDSPGHCSNIMGNYEHIGIGHYAGAGAPLWTQNFGTPR